MLKLTDSVIKTWLYLIQCLMVPLTLAIKYFTIDNAYPWKTKYFLLQKMERFAFTFPSSILSSGIRCQ